MAKRVFVLIVLAGLSVVLWQLFQAHTTPETLGPTAEYYATHAADEVGAPNLVTAVVVSYRGLDTLGEVTILFVTAAILAYFLGGKGSDKPRVVRPASELLTTAAQFLTPFILLLGVYVFVNGHLTPGGGFQGGAILASALVLLLLADPTRKVGTRLFAFVESLSGFTYVGLGVAGVLLAGGFLDPALLPLGTFGTLLSAGAVPVIYVLVGLKVGTELSGILAKYQQLQEDDQ